MAEERTFNEQALAERYAAVRNSLPSHVTLVAVSKTRSVAEIQALYDLGHRAFGENYPQELRDKHPLLPADIEWHFIGHLQTNKVKYIAPFTHLVQGVDSPRLLKEIERRAAAIGRVQDVLLQIHIANEETKQGLTTQEADHLILGAQDGAFPHVRIRGLMGMASNTTDRGQVRQEFETLAAFFHQVRAGRVPLVSPFDQLSMGMSGDSDLAIAAGSTMVRIGTAIFGDRSYPTRP